MEEELFDSLVRWDSFTAKDAARADARFRRCAALAAALYGISAEKLARQLLAPAPDIPPGFALDDFRELERNLQNLSRLAARHAAIPLHSRLSQTISVGAQRLTVLEARCEIVRRAIEFLERR